MSKLNSFITLLVIATGIQACTPAQQTPQDLQTRIKQVEEGLFGEIKVEGEGESKWTIEGRMAHYKIPGLSMAVIKDHQLDWAKGYGLADVSENRPVTEETLFQAASISKSLNGVGVMRLVQDGKLDLTSDINTFLTSWKFPYDSLSNGKKITIAHVLSHTGGLSIHGFSGYEPGEPLPTTIEILDGKQPANSEAVRSMFEPGTKRQYSGGGTTVTQLIVTDITNTPYDQFMADNVLTPMGMSQSFFTQPPPGDKELLLATAYQQDGSEVKGKYHIYPEQAAAGLWTNPTDLSKYIIETQLSLARKSSKILDQPHTKTRLTPVLEMSALGIFIQKFDEGEYFQHSGGNAGFRSIYMGSMEGGNGLVVMVNSDNGMIIQEILNSVFSVYGWHVSKPEIKTIARLTPGQWKSLEGTYEMEGKPYDQLLFTTRDDKLVLTQSWDDREVTLEAESETEFFCRDFRFPLEFKKNDKGESVEVVAFGRDVWKKVKAR